MKKLSVLLMLVLFQPTFNFLFAQNDVHFDKVLVLAIKGKIFFENKILQSGDTVKFNVAKEAKVQLKFSSTKDWIKVMDFKNKNVHHFYQQKKNTCINCLGTRGNSTALGGSISLAEYFGRKTIFLFEDDTLNFWKPNRITSKNSIAIFQINYNGSKYDRIVGNYDTIIISFDRLFGFDEFKNTGWPSFLTDSIRLIYQNIGTNKQTIPNLPSFNVVFFKDAFSFLKNIGLSSDEIFIELKENFVELESIVIRQNLNSYAEAEQWLKLKIMEYDNNTVPE